MKSKKLKKRTSSKPAKKLAGKTARKSVKAKPKAPRLAAKPNRHASKGKKVLKARANPSTPLTPPFAVTVISGPETCREVAAFLRRRLTDDSYREHFMKTQRIPGNCLIALEYHQRVHFLRQTDYTVALGALLQ